jgi:hypothetical protein
MKIDGFVKEPWVITREFQRPSFKGNLTIKTPTSRSLDPEKEQRLIEAHYAAMMMVSKARKALVDYGANSPQRVQDLLQMIFSSDFIGKDHNLLQKLRDKLTAIEEGLSKELTLKVIFPPQSDVVWGYVAMRVFSDGEKPSRIKKTDVLHNVYGRWGVTGNIHIAYELLSNSTALYELAKTIVHEASHRFCVTLDLQYLRTEAGAVRYQYMTPQKALENADSIARFCQYLTVPNLEVHQPLAVEGKSEGLQFMNGKTRC